MVIGSSALTYGDGAERYTQVPLDVPDPCRSRPQVGRRRKYGDTWLKGKRVVGASAHADSTLSEIVRADPCQRPGSAAACAAAPRLQSVRRPHFLPLVIKRVSSLANVLSSSVIMVQKCS